jgi:AraC-like DNA-binding protein
MLKHQRKTRNRKNRIDHYVTLEAKVLLESINMTILQISDELNFPSQSFFGKYFKRVVGVSPKEYLESKMQ